MEEAGETGENEVMDLYHLVPLVVSFPLVSLLTPYLSVSLIAFCVFFEIFVLIYIFSVLKDWFGSEKLRIQAEERNKINARKVMTEGETLRWMNEGLKAMWPISMRKFASQHFFLPMAPWFLDRFKPPYVKEVALQSVDLGSSPPHFSLIRAMPSPQDGDDVVFEANMEFLSAKDMNAEMTVRVSGMKVTFYISKLHIKGRVKFGVKFVKGWPVIGRVRFSFAERPFVDMTAKPRYGFNVKVIPGAAAWLVSTLDAALGQSVVEPFMLKIDFEKLVSNMMFSDLMPRQGFQEFFSVEPESGFSQQVRVQILETGYLKPPKGAGVRDYLVEVTLGNHKRTIKSKRDPLNPLNPVWVNEVEPIPIANWALANLLLLQVKSRRSMTSQAHRIGICSILVKDFRNGKRHEMKLDLDKGERRMSTGWIRFAITVENSQDVEEPAANIGSQPTTRDLPSTSPPLSAATSTVSAALIHSRNTSIEDVTAPLEEYDTGGSVEIIKMPYGPDGAFSIECPGAGEALYFSDPPASARKPREEVALESKVQNAKVERSMLNILRGGRRRNGSSSKVSQGNSPPEREMALSEQSGYTSSLDRSTDLTSIHLGSIDLKLLSPEMPSRDPPPPVDIHPMKLEPTFCEDPDPMKTYPDFGRLGQKSSDLTEPQPHHEVQGSGFSRELMTSSLGGQESEKQNSKNSRWKFWSKLQKKRTSRGARRGSSTPNPFSDDDQLEGEPCDPSDTSASQSFRKERQDINILKALMPRHQVDNIVPATDNGHSILNGGRSQSCRHDPSSKKLFYRAGLSHSMRMDPSPSFLKTIHEKQL